MARMKGIVFTILAFIGVLSAAEMRPDLSLAPLLSGGGDTLVIAHRGASLCAPQNTMAAFRKAVELGADGVEFDVLFTRDGVPVVAHITTGGLVGAPARISEMDYAEVAALDSGAWFSEEYAGETIPTLEETLQFFSERVDRGDLTRVYIHDKRENDYSGERAERVELFADIIRRTDMADHSVVMVENGDVSRWLAAAPDITVTQNWSGRDDQSNRFPLAEARDLGLKHFSMYHSYAQLNPALLPRGLTGRSNLGTYATFWPPRRLVADYQEDGGEFVVFTINDPMLMRLYLDAGFDAIGTDDVMLLRQIVGGAGRATAGLCELPDL